MSANPIDLVGGLATTANVVKADISAWAKARVPQVLANATEVRNTTLAAQLMLVLKASGIQYFLDSTDTTTADDGVNCIISSDGFRFKPLSMILPPTLTGLGGVFASNAVANQWVTGLDTSGNLTRSGLSGITTAMFAASVVDTDGTFAANSDTRIASQKATKTYVDTVAQGLDPKQSVLVATTANITLSGEQTIDGQLTSASRILVWKQSTASQNGIYVTGAGAWTRALDFDSWTEVPGAYVFAETGTLYGDCGFVCTSNVGGTLGTTAISFVQFAGAGTYSAGTGLTLTGTQFAIDATVATLTGAQALTNKTYNGLTLTSTTGTITLANGKTLTVNNTLILNGTDGASVSFGLGGTVAYVANKLSVFAATTSAELAGVISDETGSGALVFGTAPTIAGGTHTAITSLGIRSSGTGAFDLSIANSENLTAGRALTLTVNDAARTINLAGNLTLAGALTTSGAFALTLTQTGTTSVTLPTSGTLLSSATLASGDLTGTYPGPTIAANAITNAKLATAAAWTLKGNATSGAAVPTDIDVTALTLKAAPVSADIVLIHDSAASNAFKKTTVGAIASAGSVASIAGNTGAFTLSTGLTNSTNDIRLALNNATLQTAVTAPAATSAGPVMCGMGSTAKLTPVYSGRVLIVWNCQAANSSATGSTLVSMRYGTGAAPSNGAAATGTSVGSNLSQESTLANAPMAFFSSAIITGLTPGTAYWFDLTEQAGGGTATLSNVSFSAMEF